MAPLTHEPGSPTPVGPLRVRIEPVRWHHTMFEGVWWPSSTDLGAELPDLVPLLDHVRGPVTRLLLSVAGWPVRPRQIIAAGRPVSIGYLAGQSPSMMTVLCAGGGMFDVRVALPGEAPSVPDRPETGRDEAARQAEGDGLPPLWTSTVR